MNVEIRTEAAQFPEKEYINGISVAVYDTDTIVWTKLYYGRMVYLEGALWLTFKMYSYPQLFLYPHKSRIEQ